MKQSFPEPVFTNPKLVPGTGVTVSEAAPGPVEPKFDQVAGIDGGATPGEGIFRITTKNMPQMVFENSILAEIIAGS
jgi:hypothetical protein